MVFINDGTGRFSDAITVASSVVVDSMAVADFNRNGRLELAVLERPISANRNNIVIYAENSQGAWSAVHDIDVAGSGAMAVGDFNGDGIPDIIVGNESLSYSNPNPAPVPAGDLIFIPGSKISGFGARSW